MSFPVMQIQNVRYNFERIDERLIELQRHRYLSIVDIAITEGELSDFDAHSFFRSLLSHRVYRDHYIGRGSYEETGDKLLHGPYLIDRLRPEYYREMTLPALRQAFVDRMNDPEWVKYDGAPPRSSQNEVDSLLESLPDATLCFELAIDQEVNKELCHELAWVISDFREYPLILIPDRTLRLCVFNFD